MTPKADVTELRKNQILDAALRVFARLGFDQARMEDIVNEAGLSKGGLYWYFDSKEQIIIGVLERMISGEISVLSELGKASGSVSERLENMVHILIADLNEVMEYIPVMYEFYALGMRDEKVRQIVYDSLNSYAQALVPLVQQGIQAGELRQVDPLEAALAIGAIIEGTILLKAYNPDLVDLGAQMQAGMQIVLQGLLAGDMKDVS
jgi:TetR/AcrR family fatty acid metabolism transcriptional regulator